MKKYLVIANVEGYGLQYFFADASTKTAAENILRRWAKVATRWENYSVITDAFTEAKAIAVDCAKYDAHRKLSWAKFNAPYCGTESLENARNAYINICYFLHELDTATKLNNFGK